MEREGRRGDRVLAVVCRGAQRDVRSGRRLGRGPRGGARRRRSSNESVAKSGRFFSDHTCRRKSPEGRQTYASVFRDDDDLSCVCMFRRGLVRRSCLVVIVVRQKCWWWLPADGRAARRRERGVARRLVRACGVAICDAGRLVRGARQMCSASRARAAAHECRLGERCFV